MSLCTPLAFFSGVPGAGELIVVFLVVLILFGPKRLPEIARTIGKALDQMRRASQDFRDQVMGLEESTAVDVPSEPDEHGEADGVLATDERAEADTPESPEAERRDSA